MSADATTQKYGTIITATGKAAIANAVATNTLIDIKYIALGDGGGNEYYPGEGQTALKKQVYQMSANSVYVDHDNPNWIVVEGLIPESAGGFIIREAAIKTGDGNVIAIGSYPTSYKPKFEEGAAVAIGFKFIMEITNADVVNLNIDPMTAYATIVYVNNKLSNHAQETNAHGGTYSATPLRLMLRNEDGRCRVADPEVEEDAVNLQTLIKYVAGGFGSYEATQNTVALRNNTGRTQVEDPVESLDAVNYRTLLREIGRAGTNVKQPAILSPEAGTVMQSLSFQVTTSEIELVAGGVPLADMVNWRVLSPDRTQVLAFGTGAYTTTPTVTVPEASAGDSVLVLVQHSDVTEGHSPWSDDVAYAIAAEVLMKVNVITPLDGASGVLPNGLTVTVEDGEWADGSAFDGSQSRLAIYAQADNSTVWDSGWTDYSTSFSVPSGILNAQTSYWAMAQHRAASAPAGNPDAVLTSPTYGITDPSASSFTTIAATAPNVSGLTHTIPAVVEQGMQKTFTISGATSSDSGEVTYTLVNPVGGLSFSKTEGIADGEEVTMFVPSSGVVVNASVGIQARSSFGANASPVTANVMILVQTQWIFTNNATFTPPVEADYRIAVGGGGGSGNNGQPNIGPGSNGGGGGGCSVGIYHLTALPQVITIGVGGGWRDTRNGTSSSFGILLSATGGTAAGAGGTGVNGNISNSTGGSGAGMNGGTGAGGGNTGQNGGSSAYGSGGLGGVGGGGGAGAYADTSKPGGTGGKGSVVINLIP